MPRSPSPPRFRGPPRYRDDSPPRRYTDYRDRSPRDRDPRDRDPRDRDRERDRTWGDYHRDRRGGPGGPSGGGSSAWDDRPYRPPHRGGYPSEAYRGAATGGPSSGGPYRSGPPSRGGSSRGSPPPGPPKSTTLAATPNASARGRSATPEEGQITSPLPPSRSALPIRPRSPLPFRRRSPSPIPPSRFRDSGGYGRDSRDDWGDRDRDRPFDRNRDRDGYWRDRERDRDPRETRGYRRDWSRTPPSYQSRRSPSPSSLSSRSLSSRYLSPRRSPPPLDRRHSPERRGYSPGAPVPLPPRATPPSRPVEAPPQDTKPTQPLTTSSTATGATAPSKVPPLGPRSERGLPIPTGPRALSGGNPFRSNPYAAPPLSSSTLVTTTSGVTVPQIKTESQPSPPAPSASAPNPVAPRSGSVQEEKPNPYAARPSSGISPSTSNAHRLSWSERKNMSPITPGGDAVPIPSGPTPTPYRAETTSNVDVKTESETLPESDSGPVPVPASAPIKVESGETQANPYAAGVGTAAESSLSDTEIAELRRKDEELRILAELPPLKVPYGIAQWEIDLGNHYKHIHSLTQHANRAQSGARIAAAILADAEAERVAAMERRKIAEGQLMAGSLGVGIIGGV